MSSADASSSPLRTPISPLKRKQLQQCFEHGNKKMTQGEFDYANEMFSSCTLGDPGNVIYAQTFVGNLRQKYGNNKKGSKMAFLTGAKSRTLIKKSEMQKDWDGVLKHGAELLQLNPWDASALTAMARAAGEIGYDEVQLAYLRMALDANPEDPDVNRLCGTELRSRQQYDQALACWSRVLKAKPDDMEAKKAVADITIEKTIAKGRYEDADLKKTREAMDHGPTTGAAALTPEQLLERDIKKNPGDISKYIELAELHSKNHRYAEAEAVFLRGCESVADDTARLDLKERLLDTQSRRFHQELLALKDSYEKARTEEVKQQFEQLKTRYQEKMLEVHRFRVERYPNNPAFRYDLGTVYQQNGLFKEAIAEYQKAKLDTARRGVCLLALGQCFQQIQQYRLAMSHYEEAVEAISGQDVENKKRALYLSAKLAYGLKDMRKADQYAGQLASLDFSYKDVADLLDKIASNRQDSGSS